MSDNSNKRCPAGQQKKNGVCKPFGYVLVGEDETVTFFKDDTNRIGEFLPDKYPPCAKGTRRIAHGQACYPFITIGDKKIYYITSLVNPPLRKYFFESKTVKGRKKWLSEAEIDIFGIKDADKSNVAVKRPTQTIKRKPTVVLQAVSPQAVSPHVSPHVSPMPRISSPVNKTQRCSTGERKRNGVCVPYGHILIDEDTTVEYFKDDPNRPSDNWIKPGKPCKKGTKYIAYGQTCYPFLTKGKTNIFYISGENPNKRRYFFQSVSAPKRKKWLSEIDIQTFELPDAEIGPTNQPLPKKTIKRRVQPPTVQPPTVQLPTVQQPTVQQPTVQPPTVQPPTVQQPTVQQPTVQPTEKELKRCATGERKRNGVCVPFGHILIDEDTTIEYFKDDPNRPSDNWVKPGKPCKKGTKHIAYGQACYPFEIKNGIAQYYVEVHGEKYYFTKDTSVKGHKKWLTTAPPLPIPLITPIRPPIQPSPTPPQLSPIQEESIQQPTPLQQQESPIKELSPLQLQPSPLQQQESPIKELSPLQQQESPPQLQQESPIKELSPLQQQESPQQLQQESPQQESPQQESPPQLQQESPQQESPQQLQQESPQQLQPSPVKEPSPISVYIPPMNRLFNKQHIMSPTPFSLPPPSKTFITDLDDHLDLSQRNDLFPTLYPNINDPHFNQKLSQKKEFQEIKYDNQVYNVEERANQLCNVTNFELAPYQLFVKNFLSIHTPYNSLLLYAGLGTGKTCSAIGIAEEMRSFMKQSGIKKKIMIVADPNVQKNFRSQLFNETKLTWDDTIGWNIRSCVGNALLKEINPNEMGQLSESEIIQYVNKLINKSYEFVGYRALANIIMGLMDTDKDEPDKKRAMRRKRTNIRQMFNGRLMIFDEVHNIRTSEDGTEQTNKKPSHKIGNLLLEVARYAENMKLLFLSATPVYNMCSEIILLANIMNANDKRTEIKVSDVFTDNEGTFRQASVLKNGIKVEGGKELLIRKLTGYVSFVRGENPYVFPFRIYPMDFFKERSVLDPEFTYPSLQLNGKPFTDKIQYVDLFISPIVPASYQEKVYTALSIFPMEKEKGTETGEEEGEEAEKGEGEGTEAKEEEEKEKEDMDNIMATYGYTVLNTPLQALNMVFPSDELDMSPSSIDALRNSIGDNGLNNVMESLFTTVMQKGKETKRLKKPPYAYNKNTLQKYGRIFAPNIISNYSAKIASICDAVKQSTGVVLIYSQYIGGGILPLAMALEEMGIKRFTKRNGADTPLLLETSRSVPPLHAITMTPHKHPQDPIAYYTMITGNADLSPNNANDIKYLNNNNKYGEKVKVVLISDSGAEGLDFQNIRQVHVFTPWYTLNKTEQIIGRGVRNLSHCALPFNERNVEIYLHASSLGEKESADLYMYRYAEKKAIQCGRINRLMKEISVDCRLNIGQTNMKVEDLAEKNGVAILKTSSNKTIEYQIGDKPFSSLCDYMGSCDYTCHGPTTTTPITNSYTYTADLLKTNNPALVEKIKALFRDKLLPVWSRDELIRALTIVKPYSLEQIYYALTFLIQHKTEYLIDRYGRLGNLVNQGTMYMFQPLEITDTHATVFERSVPVEYKRGAILFDVPTNIQVPENQEKERVVPKHPELEQLYISTITTAMENIPAVSQPQSASWYTIFASVRQKIIGDFANIPVEWEKMVTYHFLDTATIAQKFEYATSDYLRGLSPHIVSYFKTCIFADRYMILYDGQQDKNVYYVKKTNEPTWEEKINQEIFEEGFKSLMPDIFNVYADLFFGKPTLSRKINNHIGFMTAFNGEIVFKIVEITGRKGSKGTVVSSLSKNNKVIPMLNRVLKECRNTKEYTELELKSIDLRRLAVMFEMIMRVMNETTNWCFFYPEQFKAYQRIYLGV